MPTTQEANQKLQTRDAVFCELALRAGKITPDVIQKGRNILEEMGRFGITKAISSVLVERKLLDREQEKELMREFAKLQVSCPRCRKAVPLEELAVKEHLRCRNCQSILGVELKAGAGGEGGSRIEDRLKTVVLKSGEPAHGEPAREAAPRKGPPSVKPGAPAPKASRPTAADVVSDKPRTGLEPSRAAAEPASARPQINARATIKRYHIEGIISSGSYGRLYRARRAGEAADAPVLALKVFDPEHVDFKGAAKLKAEFSAWSALDRQCPDPPHLLDEEEGLRYLVRPYVAEPYAPLHDLQVSDMSARVDVLRRLSARLKAIHAAGRVHGNLKPSNIFVHPKDPQKVLLVDPALYHLLPRDRTLRWKLLADAPRYRSPEEIAGDEPTLAADVYALGWIFYSVLMNAPPFAGLAPPEILRRHREGPCPELPPEMGEWRKLHESMTALRPEDRPPGGAMVLSLVEEILAGKKPSLPPVTARPTPTEAPRSQAAHKPHKRHELLWRYGLGPAALVLTLGWVGYCVVAWSEARSAFASDSRTTVLFHGLAEEAFKNAREEAVAQPARRREIWTRFLRTYSGTPWEAPAQEEKQGLSPPSSGGRQAR